MPAGKRHQSNTILFTLILFVALFIVASVVAVVFYTKSEDNRTRLLQLEGTTNELATVEERNRLSTIVGDKLAASYLGTLQEFHDKAAVMILGMPVESTSAEAKSLKLTRDVVKTVELAQGYMDAEKIDPNTGLIPIINKLTAALNNTQASNIRLQDELNKVRKNYEQVTAQLQATEKTLTEEKNTYFQQSQQVAANYKELEDQRNQAADERVETVQGQLNQERNNVRSLNQELLLTQAKLDQTQGKYEIYKKQITDIKPDPNRAIEAYKPDGRIILVDDASGVVHINVGKNDHVYKGLTFSVFDKGASLQSEDAFKAEIEVFGVSDKWSQARIVKSNPRNPVVTNDTIANLIWDAQTPGTFVLAGDFDLDDDGFVDADATDRIEDLIRRWGGLISVDINIDTDYVIVGNKPVVPKKPTFEDLEVDPLAQERYNSAEERLSRYSAITERAESLMLPVFTYNKFLYLIGYTGQIGKPDAF